MRKRKTIVASSRETRLRYKKNNKPTVNNEDGC